MTLASTWYVTPFASFKTAAKAIVGNTAQTLDAVNNELKNTTETIRRITTDIQQNINAGEEARTAAKEAVELVKANLEMARQMKNTGLQASGTNDYFGMADRNATLAGISNTQAPTAPPVQTKRGVVMTPKDPSIIQSSWAMNPHNFKAHIE
jgi:hypothetical protein